MEYRQLDKKMDWPFFDTDFNISSIDRESIQALSKESSMSFWSTYISARPSERHGMLLPKDHWLLQGRIGPNWIQEWNEVELNNFTGDFILGHFEIPETEVLYFTLMRESTYAVTLRTFVKNWQAFLALDDERPILLHPRSGNYALFGPNGQLHVGKYPR